LLVGQAMLQFGPGISKAVEKCLSLKGPQRPVCERNWGIAKKETMTPQGKKVPSDRATVIQGDRFARIPAAELTVADDSVQKTFGMRLCTGACR